MEPDLQVKTAWNSYLMTFFPKSKRVVSSRAKADYFNSVEISFLHFFLSLLFKEKTKINAKYELYEMFDSFVLISVVFFCLVPNRRLPTLKTAQWVWKTSTQYTHTGEICTFGSNYHLIMKIVQIIARPDTHTHTHTHTRMHMHMHMHMHTESGTALWFAISSCGFGVSVKSSDPQRSVANVKYATLGYTLKMGGGAEDS